MWLNSSSPYCITREHKSLGLAASTNVVGLRVAPLSAIKYAFSEAFVKEPVHFFVNLAFIGSSLTKRKAMRANRALEYAPCNITPPMVCIVFVYGRTWHTYIFP